MAGPGELLECAAQEFGGAGFAYLQRFGVSPASLFILLREKPWSETQYIGRFASANPLLVDLSLNHRMCQPNYL
jgi:hypothetical protein